MTTKKQEEMECITADDLESEYETKAQAEIEEWDSTEYSNFVIK